MSEVSTYIVRGVERFQRPGFFGETGAEGVSVRVDAGPVSFWFSRLSDETYWVCDVLINDGFPVFVHGEGERTTVARTAGDPDLVALLDEAAKGVTSDAGELAESRATHTVTTATGLIYVVNVREDPLNGWMHFADVVVNRSMSHLVDGEALWFAAAQLREVSR